MEYELRLLPDDECIIFVRGENPIRDKKWFPWEHEEYLEARKCGVFNPSAQKKEQERQMEQCQFVGGRICGVSEKDSLDTKRQKRTRRRNNRNCRDDRICSGNG